jgi:hypothetical protein
MRNEMKKIPKNGFRVSLPSFKKDPTWWSEMTEIKDNDIQGRIFSEERAKELLMREGMFLSLNDGRKK